MRKLWLLPCLTVLLSAADITGKWTGNIEVNDVSSGTVVNTPVRVEFQQKANLISGKIARREDDQAEAIRNGKVDGNKVVFEVMPAETSGAVKFDLTLDGNRMEGDMKGAIDSGPISGKVHLTRQEAQNSGQR